MRKFLAALMAVMMLASILSLAIGAEGAVTTFDKSTKADAGQLDLVITEMVVDSKTNIDGFESADAFEYLEIYNRGSEAVDLSQYCILMASDFDNNSAWKQTHKFTGKVNLVSGDVYGDVALGSSLTPLYELTNPSDCTLAPGKFAVIWFWTNDCNSISQMLGESLSTYDPDDSFTGVSHPGFRQFFESEDSNCENGIPDDTLVMAVMAANTIGDKTGVNVNGFNLANDGARVYAIADKSYDLLSDSALAANGKINSKVKCFFSWGTTGKVSHPKITYEQVSTIYVPSDAEPYLYNQDQILNLEEGKTPLHYDDYAQKDAANFFEVSYNEVSAMTYWESPTPGTMMPYQWIYVDEARTPDSAKLYAYDETDKVDYLTKGETENANWKADSLKALVASKIEISSANDKDETQREEVIYKDREDLGNQGQNKQNTTKDKGLPTWALILIIVGGVLVVAAVAVVVIFVVMKKNKPVAADDVAAEGEVQIIDENGADAPEATETDPASEDTPE